MTRLSVLLLILTLSGCARAPRAYYDPIRHTGCAGKLYINGVLWTAQDVKKYGWPSGEWRCGE